MGSRGTLARWVFVGALAAAIAAPHRAQACSFGGFANAMIDPALRVTDQQPPALPPPGPLKITRGTGAQPSGCGSVSTSCDDVGSVQVTVAATDDQTPPARLGYRVRSAGGTLPAEFSMPAQPVEALAGVLFFFWIDGGTDDQEAVDFSLEITAVDGAGNESAPQTVRVQHGGSGGGCGLTARRAGRSLPLPFAVALIALAARRRRAV